MSLKTSVIVLSLFCLSLAGPASADNPPQPKAVLQGGAKATVMDVLAGVKQLTTMCKRVDEDTKIVLYECQRRNMVAVGGPNLIGGTVIPAMPNPSGVMTLPNFLPVRKQRLDEMMSDINPLVSTIQTQVDVIVMPNGVSQDDLNRLKTLQQLSTDIQALNAKLNAVTRGPQYNNLRIAEHAMFVHDKAKEIDTVCKELERSLRHEH